MNPRDTQDTLNGILNDPKLALDQKEHKVRPEKMEVEGPSDVVPNIFDTNVEKNTQDPQTEPTQRANDVVEEGPHKENTRISQDDPVLKVVSEVAQGSEVDAAPEIVAQGSGVNVAPVQTTKKQRVLSQAYKIRRALSKISRTNVMEAWAILQKLPSPSDLSYEEWTREKAQKFPILISNDPDDVFTMIENPNHPDQRKAEDEVRELVQFGIQYIDKRMPLPRFIANGNELRNVNSFEYLSHIAQFIPAFLSALPEDLKAQFDLFYLVADVCEDSAQYFVDGRYGDLYTDFLKQFTANMQIIKKMKADATANKNTLLVDTINNLISSVYANPNFGLERSTACVLPVIRNTKHTDKKRGTQKSITKYLDGEKAKKYNLTAVVDNKLQPTYMEKKSWWHGTKAFFAGFTKLFGSFSSQLTTSQASIRVYDYKINTKLPTEFRFGTQGIYKKGKAGSSELFRGWLETMPVPAPKPATPAEQQRTVKKPTPVEITHIYFNNLPIHKTKFFSGTIEVPLTKQLHALEADYDHLAVITLPADHGMLEAKKSVSHKKAYSVEKAKSLFLAIASQDEGQKPSKKIYDLFPNFDALSRDFVISEKIKKVLYGTETSFDVENKKYVFEVDKKKEEATLTRWIAESFEDLRLEDNQELSEAQLQAAYFHFIKFRLTDHIIRELKAKSFNMSCKDAIDRGGASSAYYNLIQSIELNNPMSEAEFLCALHGAPTLVKGRGMNHHIQLLWNAIDTYINANEMYRSIPEWLIQWRNKNAPKDSQCYWLNQLKTFINETDLKLVEEDKARKLAEEKAQQHKNKYQKTSYSFEVFSHTKSEYANTGGAAQKLLMLANGREDIVFTAQELKALKTSKLKIICNGMSRVKLLASNFDKHLSPIDPLSKPGFHR